MSSTAVHAVEFRVMDPRVSDPTYRIDVHATRAEIDALVQDGYLIGYEWFTNEQIARFRSALDRIYREEPFEPDDRVDRYGGWRYLRFLLDKDPAFLDLLQVTPAMTIAQAVLGPQVRLDHVDGKYGPGDLGDQFVPWHIHHRVIPDPIPPFFSYPHAIHCLLYLDDLDEQNGCLCVIPGSHKLPHLSYVQDEHGDRPDQRALPVRAGGCVLIHANLWHRVLPSSSRGRQRRLIIFGYLPAWMKAGEEGTPPRERVTDRLRSTGDPLTRQLLGEFYWG
jgi:hypothetical protein